LRPAAPAAAAKAQGIFARENKKIPKTLCGTEPKNGFRLLRGSRFCFIVPYFYVLGFVDIRGKKLLSAAAAADNYYRDKNDDPAVIVAEERIKAAHCTASLH